LHRLDESARYEKSVAFAGKADFSAPDPAVEVLRAHLEIWSTGLAIFAFAILVLAIGGRWFRWMSLPLREPPSWTVIHIAVAVVYALLITTLYLAAPSFPILPALLLALIITIFVLLLAIYALGKRLRLPLLTALAAAAAIFSALDLNDNHEIRILPTAQFDPNQRFDDPTTEHGWVARPRVLHDFQRWLNARLESGVRDKDRRYPVVVVSAEGGGVYAAYFTALTLAHLDAQVPHFANHIYLLSGVSGGSLGAALYVALATARADGPPACRGAALPSLVDRFFQSDFLTPVLMAALGPDLIQRFIFFPIPQFDRARAFEDSLIKAWDDVVSQTGCAWPNPFRTGIRAFYRSDRQFNRPRLVLNTVRVADGNQIPISYPNLGLYIEHRRSVVAPGMPWQPNWQDMTRWTSFGRPGDFFSISLQTCAKEIDVSLATAVGLSARFPFVTPAGRLSCRRSWFGASDQEKLRDIARYIDGGYYDNSGTSSLTQVITELAASREAWPQSNFKIIHLHLGLGVGQPSLQPEGGFNEIMSIIRGIANARVARGTEAVNLVKLLGQLAASDESGFYELFHIDGGAKFPLGWRLSHVTTQGIATAVGSADECSSDLQNIMEQRRSIGSAERNRCFQRLLLDEILEYRGELQ
jgi:hypothetical protein